MADKFIIGIDLGGTNLKVALLDKGYRIKDKDILNTRRFSARNALISAIADSVVNLIKANNLGKTDILGIGIGLPGPVDREKGVVHFFPNIPGWREVGLKGILERRLKIPVAVDNDAKLMCIAEHALGAAKGFNNAVCVTLGTGVGGGIIINGALYRGSSNASGEIGHIPINEKGPRCNCGGYACLEDYIGNNVILKKAKKAFGRDIQLEELSSLAKRGNLKARAIWLEVAASLSVALVVVVNLLNPDCIVIGGGVAGAGKILFDSVRKKILSRAMSVQARHVKVYKAKLGNRAGLIGAAILAGQRIRR
ncbi:MAG: ROK family protein [Candidatus Omnitrophota bacterium]|jgi:glucokinase